MNPDWRNEPVTEDQQEKLRFFGCTWDEGITAGQASDALDECARQFSDVEAAYQKRPTTPLHSPGVAPVPSKPASEFETRSKYLERTGRAHDPAWQKWASRASSPETLADQPPPLPTGYQTPSQEVTIQEAGTVSSQATTGGLVFPTREQLDEIRCFGKEPPPGLTYQEAAIWIEQCKILCRVAPQNDHSTKPSPAHDEIRRGKAWPRAYPAKPQNESPQEATIQKHETAATPPIVTREGFFCGTTEQPEVALPHAGKSEAVSLVKPQAIVSGPAPQIVPALIGASVDALLWDCQPSDGCYWQSVEAVAQLACIFRQADLASAKLSSSQSRVIADKIECGGYCVEPDARFGSGCYQWNQTLGLFKPFGCDPINPSPAFLGAANLLRLCVLVAAADDQVDEAELDVFRQVIENQLELSQTDHHRLIVLERLLAQDPSAAVKTLAKVAKSVPVHKRLLISKVLVRVAAVDHAIKKGELLMLERIFKVFELAPNTLDSLVHQVCRSVDVTIQKPSFAPSAPKIPPSQESGTGENRRAASLGGFLYWDDKIQEAVTGASGERIPARIAANPPKIFALDMSKVYSITNETKEVVGILSVLMEDEPENPAISAKTGVVPASEISKNPGDGGGTVRATRFNGLDVAFHPILERLLARDAWPQADFNALAREFHFMPLNIHDTLNEWADEALGDFILAGENPVIIRRELIAGEKAKSTHVENRSRQSEFQHRQRARGLCPRCSNPVGVNPHTGRPYRYCNVCRPKVAEAMAALMRARRAKGLA